MRAPIFYDSNDTTYYAYFNSTTSAIFRGSVGLNNTSPINTAWGDASTTTQLSITGSNYGLINLRGNLNGARTFSMGVGDNTFYMCYDNSAGRHNITVNSSGNVTAAVDFRAPIFYDSQDTTYYLDPNASSSTPSLKVAGNIDLIARSAGWAEGIRIRVPSTNTWGGIRFTRDRGDNDGNWAIGFTGIDSTDDLTFWANNGGGEAMKMRISKAGMVGIGTSPSGSYRLSVAGHLHMNYNSIDYVSQIYQETGGQGNYMYANDAGSYGTLRLTSTRNGWYGIYFDSGTTLMMNSNESGHYRQGYGWQYRWANGTMYISTGSYGGGSEYTVYHTGNLNPITTSNIGSQSVNQSNYSTMDYIMSNRDFASGTLVETSINYSAWAGDPFILEIKGNSYGGGLPFDIQIQGYIYADTIINYGWYSNGSNISGIRDINYNNNLCFWWPRQDYWQGFTVKVYTAYGGRQINKVTSLSDSSQPTTSKQVNFSPNQSVRADNIASYTAGNVNSISSAVGGGYTWTGIQNFLTNNGGYAVNNSNSAVLTAYSTGNNTAFMSFHRAGYYAVNFGLDQDNWMRIGGWSASSNRWQLNLSSGDMYAAGDITAYSDARVKTNIITIENPLKKTLALRGVTYNRTDSDDKKTKMGVIAQEVLDVIPEVVNQDNDGVYSVAYGNMVGLLIEAIKEQQQQIEELKSKLDAVTK